MDGTIRTFVVSAVAVVILLTVHAPISLANGAPIAGIVKSIDTVAGTFVVESTSKGRTRQVTIHIRGGSKIVRFQRAADASRPAFSEQAASLGDLKTGWTVSVKTRHEGDKEVAEIVNVVHEK
jgi:hypothetical protein